MDKITYLGIEIAKKYKYEANVQLCRTRLRPKFRPEFWRRIFIVCLNVKVVKMIVSLNGCIFFKIYPFIYLTHMFYVINVFKKDPIIL